MIVRDYALQILCMYVCSCLKFRQLRHDCI